MNHIRFVFLLIALSCLTAAHSLPGCPQTAPRQAAAGPVDTIGAGHTPLLTGQLRPGVRRYLIYIEDPKSPASLWFWYWTRDIEEQTVGGEKAFSITQRWVGSDTAYYREVTSLNRASDFYPIYHAEKKRGQDWAYRWDKDQITGSDTVQDNAAKHFRLAFQEPNFNWNLDIETFEMLPLDSGKTFAINFYDAGLDPPAYVTYTVKGSETLWTPDGGGIDCWLLVTEGDNKGTHYSEMYWIAKQSHTFLKEVDHYGAVSRLKVRVQG